MAAAIRVAAIQMRAKLGDVAGNLSHAESLARRAFRGGARWVILPEFFTCPAAFSPAMLPAWLPLEGPALEMLRRLAREHDGVVGGAVPGGAGGGWLHNLGVRFPPGRDSPPPKGPPP